MKKKDKILVVILITLIILIISIIIFLCITNDTRHNKLNSTENNTTDNNDSYDDKIIGKDLSNSDEENKNPSNEANNNETDDNKFTNESDNNENFETEVNTSNSSQSSNSSSSNKKNSNTKPSNQESSNNKSNNSETNTKTQKEIDDELFDKFKRDPMTLLSVNGVLGDGIYEDSKKQIAESEKWYNLGYRVETPSACTNLSTGTRCVYGLSIYIPGGTCGEVQGDIYIDWHEKDYVGVIEKAKKLGYSCEGYQD